VQVVPRVALRVASAHANKIRANGRRAPSSDRSTPDAPGSGPGRARLHFHYTHLSPFCDQSSDHRVTVASPPQEPNKSILLSRFPAIYKESIFLLFSLFCL